MNLWNRKVIESGNMQAQWDGSGTESLSVLCLHPVQVDCTKNLYHLIIAWWILGSKLMAVWFPYVCNMLSTITAGNHQHTNAYNLITYKSSIFRHVKGNKSMRNAKFQKRANFCGYSNSYSIFPFVMILLVLGWTTEFLDRMQPGKIR